MRERRQRKRRKKKGRIWREREKRKRGRCKNEVIGIENFSINLRQSPLVHKG